MGLNLDSVQVMKVQSHIATVGAAAYVYGGARVLHKEFLSACKYEHSEVEES
jgi:hypothetical protein